MGRDGLGINPFDYLKIKFNEQPALSDILNGFNRADTVNMNPDEMNNFAHISGSALLRQNYPHNAVRNSGYIKEFGDLTGAALKSLIQYNPLVLSDKWQDSLKDLKNNELGITIGEQFPDMNRNSIMQYVLKKHIEPERKNLFK
jgi:hypothetical protein